MPCSPPCFSFAGDCSSRQLSVSATVALAKVLEHELGTGPQSALPGTRAIEIMATGNDGRSDLQRSQGRPVSQSSCQVSKTNVTLEIAIVPSNVTLEIAKHAIVFPIFY